MKQYFFLILAIFLVGCSFGRQEMGEIGGQEEGETVGVVSSSPTSEATMIGNSDRGDGTNMDEGNSMGDRMNGMIPPALFAGRANGEADGITRSEHEAIQHLANQPDMSAYLENYDNWEGSTWHDEENDLYYIDLYSEGYDEFLGSGIVNAQTGEITELFIPRELTPEEYQAGLAIVEDIVFGDAEVAALLGDPNDWERGTDYDRYDASWYTWFYRGLDEWVVVVRSYDGNEYFIDDIYDQNAFDEEEQRRIDQDQAIELAFEAENIYSALENAGNWKAYASPQGDGVYAVSVAGNDTELFYALVNIEAWEILETSE
jgi:hypothetical protein